MQPQGRSRRAFWEEAWGSLTQAASCAGDGGAALSQAGLSAFTWGRSGSSISGPSSKSHRCGQWKPPSWAVQGNLRGSWASRGGRRPARTARGRGRGVWFEEPTEDPGCVQWTGHGCEVHEGRHESTSWARMDT